MSTWKHIRLDCDGPIMRVTINRPEVLNALNPEAHFELAAAFDAFASDDRLHIATISGAGNRAFCVGTDLKARAKSGRDDIPETAFAGLTERYDLTKPVVAIVNGDAIGGGLEIVLSCDLAVAVNTARFGLPEPKVGLAARGGLHRLARQIPLKHALEIALTGKTFDAESALRYGLINKLVDPQSLRAEGEGVVNDLLACAPLALRATKQMIYSGLDAPSLEKAYQAEYPQHDLMLASDDAREGISAFVEKRAPLWRGK